MKKKLTYMVVLISFVLCASNISNAKAKAFSTNPVKASDVRKENLVANKEILSASQENIKLNTQIVKNTKKISDVSKSLNSSVSSLSRSISSLTKEVKKQNKILENLLKESKLQTRALIGRK